MNDAALNDHIRVEANRHQRTLHDRERYRRAREEATKAAYGLGPSLCDGSVSAFKAFVTITSALVRSSLPWLVLISAVIAYHTISFIGGIACSNSLVKAVINSSEHKFCDPTPGHGGIQISTPKEAIGNITNLLSIEVSLENWTTLTTSGLYQAFHLKCDIDEADSMHLHYDASTRANSIYHLFRTQSEGVHHLVPRLRADLAAGEDYARDFLRRFKEFESDWFHNSRSRWHGLDLPSLVPWLGRVTAEERTKRELREWLEPFHQRTKTYQEEARLLQLQCFEIVQEIRLLNSTLRQSFNFTQEDCHRERLSAPPAASSGRDFPSRLWRYFWRSSAAAPPPVIPGFRVCLLLEGLAKIKHKAGEIGEIAEQIRETRNRVRFDLATIGSAEDQVLQSKNKNDLGPLIRHMQRFFLCGRGRGCF